MSQSNPQSSTVNETRNPQLDKMLLESSQKTRERAEENDDR